MPVVPRLVSLVSSGDLDGVDVLLRSLDADDRTEARRWFEGSRRWFREQHEFAGNSHSVPSEVYWGQYWIEGICAVTLCPPVAAARRVPWGHFWDSQAALGEAHLVHLLWDADREWVSTFIDAASRVGLGNDARRANRTLSAVLRAAAVHHALPCPAGATFLRASVTGAWDDPLSDRLRDDPLMPDLLFHYLASGHSGDHGDFPDAVKALIAEDRLDRERVLEAVLAQLTTAQRVASQRVLAGLLDAVEVTAAEIPGGLTYLLGVLSTSDGSVGRRLLPLALELVKDAAGLHELTGVIAARPERKQKEVLLRALTTPALIAGIGAAAATEALRTLAEDNNDAAFVTKINRARTKLGEIPVEAAQTAAIPLGLWALSPQARLPQEVKARYGWRESRQESLEWMLRPIWAGPGYVEDWVVNHLLNDMAQDVFDAQALRELALGLLSNAELSLPATSRLFNELFLAGGMSQTWAIALSIADAACAGARRPARLEVFLRMLATYGPEAPRAAAPERIEALAAGPGSSKVEQEARALGAALSGESTQTYLTRIRSSAAGPKVSAVRGLWRDAVPGLTWPGDRRLPAPGEVDLEHFLGAAATALDHRYRHLRQTVHDGLFVDPDLLLRDAIAAVRQHGVDRVRSGLLALKKDQKYPSTPIRAALDLWACGGLTVPVFWKLALRARTHHDVDQQWRSDPAVGPQRANELSRQLPGLGEQIKTDVPILPRSLDGRASRLTFLRGCEALLMVEQAPVLLSTPTYQDGTLDFDDLRARLAGCLQVVGPLDL
ncbi:MAG TPA: hypothetical protein VLL08_12420, partial [Kineosporiaceae bacterium]|nr:hypothetical protein [Kineosporiaceae bacterium]